MRKGFLVSLSALLSSASLALAQLPLLSPYAGKDQAVPVTAAPVAAAEKPAAEPGAATVPAATHVPGPDGKMMGGSGCGIDPCLIDCGCGPDGRFWVSGEYLLWYIRDARVPPLVTTGPATFPVGFIGQPGTQVLVNGNDLAQDDFHGGRLNAGFWLNDCRTCGIELSWFQLGEQTDEIRLSSEQFPVLARPFFNLNENRQFSEFAAFPGISTGGIAVGSSAELMGGDINLRKNLCCGCSYRLDGLVGFRYLQFKEDLNILEVAVFSPNATAFPTLAGRTFGLVDHFDTRNRFYGGQVGVDGEVRLGKAYVSGRAKLGIGGTHQEIEIRGGQTILSPEGTTTRTPGGLLALNSNSGGFSRNRFALVPELGVNVGYQITKCIRGFVGYTIIYWDDVVRPGDQIDLGLDVTRIPNFPTTATPLATRRPAVPFKETAFWAQGVNFGLELRW